MLRAFAQRRSQLVGDAWHTVRLMSRAHGKEGAAGAAQSSGLRKFFLALVPIGVIGAALEWVHKQEEAAAADVAAVTAAAAAAGQPAPHMATVHGGTTVHGVEIDPSNPLHKVLPETDCQFCLESREKLWGMMKHMKHSNGTGGKSKTERGSTAAQPASPAAAAGASAAEAEGEAAAAEAAH